MSLLDKKIADLANGDYIDDQLFLVSSVVEGTNEKDGAASKYLVVTLQDSTGTIEARKWDASAADIAKLTPGKVIQLSGMVNSYKNILQVKIKYYDVIDDPTSEELDQLRRVSPIPFDELKKKLEYFRHSFKDKDVDLVVNAVIDHFYDKYIEYPAAIKIHHEFGHGILHHSVTMATVAEAIAGIYPNVDRDILVAGALIHDIGKVVEYENPLAPEFTVEGKLAGHISIMYAKFKEITDQLDVKSEVPLLLGHMILSHHGKLEFGSPVVPMTLEAELLHLIDYMDANVMAIQKALAVTNDGEFTQRIWSMDNVAFYKPKKR